MRASRLSAHWFSEKEGTSKCCRLIEAPRTRGRHSSRACVSIKPACFQTAALNTARAAASAAHGSGDEQQQWSTMQRYALARPRRAAHLSHHPCPFFALFSLPASRILVHHLVERRLDVHVLPLPFRALAASSSCSRANCTTVAPSREPPSLWMSCHLRKQRGWEGDERVCSTRRILRQRCTL